VTDAFAPSTEVRTALDSGRPVVALETSVLGQGLPPPWNHQAAEGMETAVRDAGAVPAWIWVEGGRIRAGAERGDLDRLMDEDPAKVARRDLPMTMATGALGATTVSAMIWAARAAGIEVTATGGIGGVHRTSGDVSADLVELGRTPGTLVCSGPKSILDPIATLERLEELGVGVIGFGTDVLPFFVVRETSLRLEHRANEPVAVAEAARAREALEMPATLLVCNPCPGEAALPAGRVEEAVGRCVDRAGGVTGKAVTPHLLACLAEETGGDSLRANVALLGSNAGLAARIATHLV
jgi:pseudouridylate synthase